MKGELRRSQILEASKRVFSENGYHGSHVETIIKEAGVGKGTFYLYFKNKEDLFISLLVQFLDDWEEEVLAKVAARRTGEILDYFRDLIVSSLRFFKQHEDLCNIYLRIGSSLNTVFDGHLERFENKMLNYLKSELLSGQKSGRVRTGLNLELMANMIVGAFLRVDYFYFVLKKNQDTDIDELAEEFYEITMRGILVP